MAEWLAHKMRRWADRLDDRGAPRATFLYFTFERYKGIVINDQSRGCRLWYYGMDDYEKAHTEGTP